MDPRIERHVETVVDHCVKIEPGDMVQVVAPTSAEGFLVALYEKIAERGGRPTLSWTNRRTVRACGLSIRTSASQSSTPR